MHCLRQSHYVETIIRRNPQINPLGFMPLTAGRGLSTMDKHSNNVRGGDGFLSITASMIRRFSR